MGVDEIDGAIRDDLAQEALEGGRIGLGGGDVDGVGAEGEFFDNERLEVAAKLGSMTDIFAAVSKFCGSTPLNDDCTVVEMTFSGE